MPEKVSISKEKLDNLANAIAAMSDVPVKMSLDDMASAVMSIEGTGGEKLQSKLVTPTKAKQTVLPDCGYTGLSSVTVNAIPSQYVLPSGTLSVESNGTFNVGQYERVSVSGIYPSGDSVEFGTSL